MKRIVLTTAFLIAVITTSLAQVAVTTDGSPADASAMLDVKSTTRGILPPRMTTAQRNAIAAPANGLIVFDSDLENLWIYKSGSGWVSIASLPTIASFSTSGTIFDLTQTGTGRISRFTIDNAASNARAIEVFTNGGIGSRALYLQHSGTGAALDIDMMNAESVNNALEINHLGKGRAALIQSTNTANAQDVLDVFTAGIGDALASTHAGTAGNAAQFKNTNNANEDETVLIETNGPIQSSALSAFHTGAGSVATLEILNPDNVNNVLNIHHYGKGRGALIQSTNTANAANILTLFTRGTGSALHASTNNANATAGVFTKSVAYNGAYTPTPGAELEVQHSVLSTSGMAGLRVSNTGSNDNAWSIYVQNSNGNFSLYEENVLRGNFASGTGVYTSTSDARLKSSVTSMPGVLGSVMQLKGKRYYFTSDVNKKVQLGFLAQEVEPLFPEVVYNNKNDGGGQSYTMDYSAFGVIAIKAVQEQQVIIDELRKELNELKKLVRQLTVSSEK